MVARSFYLCYVCGELFHSKPMYDEHLVLHQAISFCYQIYDFETNSRNEELSKKRGLNVDTIGVRRKSFDRSSAGNRRTSVESVTSTLPKKPYACRKTSKAEEKECTDIIEKESKSDRFDSAPGLVSVNRSNLLTISAPLSRDSRNVLTQLLQKCFICEYRSSQGGEMVEHVVRKHNATISKLERQGYTERLSVWTERTAMKAAEHCELCEQRFDSDTNFFLHLIISHKNNLLLSDWIRCNCTVYLVCHNLPTQLIHIKMKRPSSASSS